MKNEVLVEHLHWSDGSPGCKDWVVIMWSDGTWNRFYLPFRHAYYRPDSIPKYLDLRRFQSKKIKTTKEEVKTYIHKKVFDWRNSIVYTDTGSFRTIFGCNRAISKEEKEKHNKSLFDEWLIKEGISGKYKWKD